MPFVDDLERELRRAADARERTPKRRWSLSPVLAPAAALAALVVAVIISGVFTWAPEQERPAREVPMTEPPRLSGSYETNAVRRRGWDGRWELISRDGSARLVGVMDGRSESLPAGKMTFSGDEVTFRVPFANDPYPGPLCEGKRRDTPGSYRIVDRAGGAFSLRLLRDPCKGRATILAAGVWRRAGAGGP